MTKVPTDCVFLSCNALCICVCICARAIDVLLRLWITQVLSLVSLVPDERLLLTMQINSIQFESVYTPKSLLSGWFMVLPSLWLGGLWEVW
jgi:hypothetical protein